MVPASRIRSDQSELMQLTQGSLSLPRFGSDIGRLDLPDYARPYTVEEGGCQSHDCPGGTKLYSRG